MAISSIAGEGGNMVAALQLVLALTGSSARLLFTALLLRSPNRYPIVVSLCRTSLIGNTMSRHPEGYKDAENVSRSPTDAKATCSMLLSYHHRAGIICGCL